jgi:protein SDA1
LAAAATACHELVPPDALQPMLRQLVNQFIHDRARPEVAAVGLNAVREICARCPLVIDEDLLQDLAQYKKSRDKPVSNAARGLIALFREIAPGLLEKKDRGKGADLTRELKRFGEGNTSERIDGVDLLQRDILKRKREEEATEASDEDEDDFVVDDDDDDEDDNEDEDDESGEEEFSEEDEEEEEDDERATGKRGREEDEEEEDVDPDAPAPKRRKNGKLSLAELKRRHKALVQKRKAEEEAELRAEEEAEEAELGGPVEQERILTDDDFKRIKALKTEQQLNTALSKAGASKATNVAGDAIRLMMRRADRASDRRVNPASLEATGLRKAHDKATRLASVLAGREENEYGAATARKQKKTGGSSNKEKLKKKSLPLAARVHAATRRRNAPVQKGKQQRGRNAWKSGR